MIPAEVSTVIQNLSVRGFAKPCDPAQVMVRVTVYREDTSQVFHSTRLERSDAVDFVSYCAEVFGRDQRKVFDACMRLGWHPGVSFRDSDGVYWDVVIE